MIWGLRGSTTHRTNHFIGADLREGFFAILVQDFSIKEEFLDEERMAGSYRM